MSGLFERFMREPEAMGEEWAQAAKGADHPARARSVADYIAGMTDRYALKRAEALLGQEGGGGGDGRLAASEGRESAGSGHSAKVRFETETRPSPMQR